MSCRTTSAGIAVALLLVAAAGGCDSPAAAIAAHSTGDFEGARREILASSLEGAKQTERDRLVWLMEEGKICLDAGDALTASEALAKASDWCERFAIYEPKTTISEEMASVAVNPRMRTYRGTYSDRIQVDAYAVLANLWLGRTGQAAVYANRVAERQTDAEVEQSRQIAKVEKEIGGYRGGAVKGMVSQVRASQAMRSLGASAANGANAANAAYLDPFATWICAIAWSATGESSNLERARVAFSRAAAMAPGNTVLAEQAHRNPFETARSRPQVIVLLEAGRCMSLEQIVIPVATPWSGYNGIPIPVPVEHPCNIAALSIASAGTGAGGGAGAGSMAAVRTEALSDNDAIFMAQYDRMLPEIIFRTALMVGAKAGATVAATQATRDDDDLQLAILLAMSLYQALTNEADLRSWNSVGKFTQIAQIDRPPDGRAAISVVGDSGAVGPAATVELPEGSVVILYVRSMDAASTLIHAFSIQPPDSVEGRMAPVSVVPAESNAAVAVRGAS
ncbi:MAG: hypothetical protein FJ253_07110 [Phycisphaerae bacterium]|nr:hypothetical protein [Phycisphaerae bacterium]